MKIDDDETNGFDEFDDMIEMSIHEFVKKFPSKRAAARALNIPSSTFWDMMNRNNDILVPARLHNVVSSNKVRGKTKSNAKKTNKIEYSRSADDCKEALEKLSDTFELEKKKTEELTLKCRSLQSELNTAKKKKLLTEEIRRYILNLSEQPLGPADWLSDGDDCRKSSGDGVVGVPSLMLSDIHMGETVHPSQVFGMNEYDTDVAKKRLRTTTHNVIDVLQNHMVAPKGYPGIVINLGGDLLSGDIHEELTATNDKPTLPCLVELVNELIACFDRYIEAFGRVMVFCVPGNHSRTTKKIQAKNQSFTNYDWLIGCLLERFYRDNNDIQFYVSAQPDIQYKIYNHRYRLTHGNQFRGGVGFVGPYAPISRGDRKKRSSSQTYGMDYDTLLLGHFHQLWMPGKVIVNGSVIGFNEFAMNNNFEYDDPKQALWITNPEYGITYTIPIFCEKPESIRNKEAESAWVQWYDD